MREEEEKEEIEEIEEGIILKEKYRIASIVITIIIGMMLGMIISLIFPWNFFGGESNLLSIFILIGTTIYYIKITEKEIPKRFLGVLTFLEKRLPIFLGEGYWCLLIPGIFGIEETDIREITLGKKDGKYIETKCLSRDRVEMSVAWSSQLQIIDPIKWFNTQEPIEAVTNKFLSQLRIAIDLFVSTDFNQLKGVVSGLFSGKTYAVFRLPSSYLLQDRNGNIIAEEIIGDNKEAAISEVIRRAKTVKKPFEDSNGEEFDPQKDVVEDLVEIIPPNTFRYEDLNEESSRIGAQIQAPAIKDVTPPENVMRAWEEAEIERAQKKARERENEAHMSIALNLMGKKENDDRNGWSKEEWDRFQQLMSVVRSQEKNNESIVRIIGNGDLGDKMIAAMSMDKKGE